MKRSILILVAALSISAAGHPDLAGKWQLNMAKSKFSQKNFNADGMKLEVIPDGGGYRSKLTTTDGQSGGTETEGHWFLDGQYHPIPGTRWSQMSKWDGNVLVAEKKSAEDSYEEQMRLTVSPDGKQVAEDLTVKNTNGTNSSKLIWDRVQQ
jgi:hypothetical protein